ncbi:MAG TPA: hypothetical protein VEU55_07780 [Gemmatimonadales bacterium]|nr:hypothetical protein [Gemmatimonadales bacterium]
MIRNVLGVVMLVALPVVVAGQLPHIPTAHASATAQHAVAPHRATHYRGSVVRGERDWGSNGATAATRSNRAAADGPPFGAPPTPAQPAQPAQPASPTQVATPAIPATPAHKGGSSGNHRP